MVMVAVGFNSKNTGNINEYFDIPFINRIDNIIEFNSLKKDSINDIVINNLEEIKPGTKLIIPNTNE